MDFTTALQTVRGWPADERLEFAFRVWDQLVEDGLQVEPTDELIAELDRRLAAHEANPEYVRTWEQVLERLRKPQ
jgi:putative addiction module component (TIGR02574 family)